MYALLKECCEVGGKVGEETARLNIQSYFTAESQKKWINNVIKGWKQRLNWGKIVDTKIKEIMKLINDDKNFDRFHSIKIKWPKLV